MNHVKGKFNDTPDLTAEKKNINEEYNEVIGKMPEGKFKEIWYNF